MRIKQAQKKRIDENAGAGQKGDDLTLLSARAGRESGRGHGCAQAGDSSPKVGRGRAGHWRSICSVPPERAQNPPIHPC